MKITIPGRPITKKNHGKVVKRGGRKYHVQSDAWQQYEQNALKWLLVLPWKDVCFNIPVQVTAQYWMPNNRSYPDLVGLLQGTGDVIEKAGIISNDRLIASWDGSRIMGIDKENPRVEIEIKAI